MELRHLNAFIHVATLMSFYKAAQALNYAQSTVSAQIRNLEEELGVKLFDRLGKGIRLTEAGQKLLPHARRILDLTREAELEVSSESEPFGALNIRIPESLLTFCLPPLLTRFRARFPGVGLNFFTCAFHGLEQDLRKGIADLAFLLAEGVTGSNMEVEFLGSLDLVLAAGPGHPLVGKAEIRARDLDGLPLLLSTADCSYRKGFEELLLERKVRPGPLMEFNSVAAIKKAVQAGLGLTVIPRLAVAREVMSRELVILNWVEEEMETAVLMVRHKEKWLSPTLRAFMDMAREELDLDRQES